ncbi:hypothetical protein AWB75_07166 [Caballeronia catudaia]|uniref:Uncharacterized protein n=1 Tax=Caballeronia catudaia TaxID=1777136 RepID=A0A158DTW9_9BURK|nr:hypothetical protein AWB75_07166 [Caballeronia catudaia]
MIYVIPENDLIAVLRLVDIDVYPRLLSEHLDISQISLPILEAELKLRVNATQSDTDQMIRYAVLAQFPNDYVGRALVLIDTKTTNPSQSREMGFQNNVIFGEIRRRLERRVRLHEPGEVLRQAAERTHREPGVLAQEMLA